MRFFSLQFLTVNLLPMFLLLLLFSLWFIQVVCCGFWYSLSPPLQCEKPQWTNCCCCYYRGLSAVKRFKVTHGADAALHCHNTRFVAWNARKPYISSIQWREKKERCHCVFRCHQLRLFVNANFRISVVWVQSVEKENPNKIWEKIMRAVFVKRNIRQILRIYSIQRFKFTNVKIIWFHILRRCSNWQAWRFVFDCWCAI